ncbi:hypothetical protein AMTR_s00089p00121630 [Amborella trichopoda]|uniref:Secreted protein n=1 Tax=Amborella trichopoda TaxID=13333 RepID=W1P4J1_AMBTC|nr:hypothetical protein AMTR_s00089p00121630 [Amborella trichopoda]
MVAAYPLLILFLLSRGRQWAVGNVAAASGFRPVSSFCGKAFPSSPNLPVAATKTAVQAKKTSAVSAFLWVAAAIAFTGQKHCSVLSLVLFAAAAKMYPLFHRQASRKVRNSHPHFNNGFDRLLI